MLKFFFVSLIMFFYAVKHQKKMTKYSHKFNSKRMATIWYNKYGKKIEQMFKHKFILIEK